MLERADFEKKWERLIKTERLAHGYIFFGSNVKALTQNALALAHYLETGKWDVSEKVLLDARIIDGTKENLGVDVSRAATEFLYRQPVVSARRTLIISSAEECTDQAQNALLKIAEEPPKGALIILIVRDPGVFLPALRSRFQSIFFGNAKTSRVLSELEEEARGLAEQFLLSDRKGKSALLKALNEREKEVDVKEQKLFDSFSRFLVEELARDVVKYSAALKELLKRQSAMKDLSTSKRLQLEAVIRYL